MLFRKLYLLLLCLFLCGKISAATQIFTAKGGKLDTNAHGIVFPLKVSGLSSPTLNSKFGFEFINLNIKSQEDAYLLIYLYAPDGSYYVITDQSVYGRNYDSTFFTDTAVSSIHLGKAPYKGTYISQSFLRQINNGQKGDSTWYLLVYDGNPKRKDVLISWSLGFGTHPNTDYPLDSSNLPILVINTRGQAIPQSSPMASSYVDLIDNGPGKYNFVKDSLKFKGYGGMQIHGNWSRSFPKLSYTLKTYDSNFNSKDTSIMGLPKGHDFALIANFLDRSLLRNAFSQHLFSAMGHYTPRFRHVELILNGAYQGVYLFIEKIKRASTRVNVPKLTVSDTSGDALTGGYMIKEDWKGSIGWYSKYGKPDDTAWHTYFRYYDPALPVAKQMNYIQAFYDSFEKVMYGAKQTSVPGNWRSFMDESSFTDYFFTQEITKNIDGFRASFYMYKNRNSVDRHIHLGPVWDFDITLGDWWGSAFYGWNYQSGTNGDFWWFKVMGTNGYGKGDPTWKDNTKCAWTLHRRGALSTAALDNWIDSNATLINDAQKRNYKEWPVWGMNLPIGQPVLTKNYTAEVDTLKGWVKRRLKWMDKYMPGTCRIDIDPPTVKLIGKDTVKLEVNTYYKDAGITYHDNFGDTNVKVISGNNIDTSKLGTYIVTYFLSDKAGNKASIRRVVIVIDTIAPLISFIHGDTIQAEVLEKYIDTNVIIKDNYDTKPAISKTGTFNFPNDIPDSLGYYTTWYKATDHSGNTDSVILVLHVVDTYAPAISFAKGDTIKVEVFNNYSDSDLRVKDNYDKSPVSTHNGNLKSFKTDSVGQFTIWYKASDHSGNKDSLMRIVNVVDTIAPVITLTGNDSTFVEQDSMYFDLGYKVSDNYDKYPKIDTTGDFINTFVPGVFHILYSAQDNSGNKSVSQSRTVIVSQNSGIENEDDAGLIIQVSPNPAAGIFFVRTRGIVNAKADLRVYNAIGMELTGCHYTIQSGWSGAMHMENEPSGIYTLKVQTGNTAYTTKLILIK